MGKSNAVLMPWYRSIAKESGEVALLGFSNNDYFNGDLYDLSLGNWNINSKWQLDKKYDTIICLRCAYFAKDPLDFMQRCYDHLNKGGSLYVDWALGDHWRFEDYKIGWVKGGEHEYAYANDNYLWSTVWHDSFENHIEYKTFSQRVEKFGYKNVRTAITTEVPNIMDLNFLKNKFDLWYDMKVLWEEKPQLYILLTADKRG